jgi:predicted PurR-regulated permease PerM
MMNKKGNEMKGSIRFGLGMLIVFGAVGGLDAGSDVLTCVVVAIAGLFVMNSGVKAMEKV